MTRFFFHVSARSCEPPEDPLEAEDTALRGGEIESKTGGK